MSYIVLHKLWCLLVVGPDDLLLGWSDVNLDRVSFFGIFFLVGHSLPSCVWLALQVFARHVDAPSRVRSEGALLLLVLIALELRTPWHTAHTHVDKTRSPAACFQAPTAQYGLYGRDGSSSRISLCLSSHGSAKTYTRLAPSLLYGRSYPHFFCDL